jgi:hypothetical protein
MGTFLTPTVQVPMGSGFMSYWSINEGVSVWRSGGTWFERQNPSQDEIDGADVHSDGTRLFFQGGYVHEVSASVGTLLTDEGYTVT